MGHDVVGIGHSTVDYLGLIERYPESDTKVEISEFSIQGGGPVATALVTLAALGVDTAIVSKVSDDDFGRFMRSGLVEAGVDTTGLVVEPGKVSPFSFIAVERGSGKRTIFWTRGNLGRLEPEDVDLGLLEGAKVLHVDGIHSWAQIAAARKARELGVHVVYDAGSARDGWKELVELSDTVIASERFVSEAVPGAIAESLRSLARMGPGTVVITMGPEGSVGMEQGQTYIAPALDVEAVDTTGAGDVYHGAYIYALLQGWTLQKRMRFASAAAGLKCRSLGGRAGIPTLGEILAAMD